LTVLNFLTPTMPESTSIIPSRLRLAALVARYASVLLLLAMFIGTHMPGRIAPGFSISDKLIHASAFMSLTLSLLISWELSAGVLQPQHYFAVWLFCTLYGVFDEITQIPVGRSCDGLDWLADIGGILVGLILYRLVRPLFSRWI
jgi:VanZ family protein